MVLRTVVIFRPQDYQSYRLSSYYLYFAAILFQENLLKTMIQMENTFFALGERFNRDCIIICDRGTMDASACK
jgi:hypothetical protein